MIRSRARRCLISSLAIALWALSACGGGGGGSGSGDGGGGADSLLRITNSASSPCNIETLYLSDEDGAELDFNVDLAPGESFDLPLAAGDWDLIAVSALLAPCFSYQEIDIPLFAGSTTEHEVRLMGTP